LNFSGGSLLLLSHYFCDVVGMRQAVHQYVVVILHFAGDAYTADAAEPLPEALRDLYVANIAMTDFRGVAAEDAVSQYAAAGSDSQFSAPAPHFPAKQHDGGKGAWDERDHSHHLDIEAVDTGDYRHYRRAQEEHHIEEERE
jgi:hypothetical protein